MFRLDKGQGSERVEIDYSESESEEELLMEAGGGRDEGERWDCESILSTYSNLYNHPTLIEIPSFKPAKVSYCTFGIIHYTQQTRKESMNTECDPNEATLKPRASSLIRLLINVLLY